MSNGSLNRQYSMNRYLSMPSYDQIDKQFSEEEQPLRIHVGNIPFLWTIDDLRKQFLVRLIILKSL
jgi:hypothetical protein